MTLSRRDLLKRSGVATALAAGWSFSSSVSAQEAAGEPVPEQVHFLRRVTWGVRPGEVERLNALGCETYLERQFDYDTLPDPEVEAFIAKNETLLADIGTLRDLADRDYGRLMEQTLWARLYRAATSERQLFERMVELWTDHFNIPIPDLMSDKIIDDREVIRVHALGRFSDLLRASAMSPATRVPQQRQLLQGLPQRELRARAP